MKKRYKKIVGLTLVVMEFLSVIPSVTLNALGIYSDTIPKEISELSKDEVYTARKCETIEIINLEDKRIELRRS